MRLTWSPVSAAVTPSVHTPARTLRGPSSSVEAGSPPVSTGSPRRPRPPPSSTSQGVPWPSLLPPRVCSPSEPLLSVPLQTTSCHSHTPNPPAASPGSFPRPSGPPPVFNVISRLLSLWSQHSSPTHPLTGPSSAPSSMGLTPAPAARLSGT